MREIWDKEKGPQAEKKHRKERQTQQQSTCFPNNKVRESSFRKHFELKEKQLVKIRKYYIEHLELKKTALDFFPEYQKYLGEGGFTKV